jgi:hypothetical protein
MKFILICLLSVISVFGYSQNTIQINNATISSNFNLSHTIDIHKQKNEKTDEIKGYRIQIISDNNRSNVYNQKAKVYQHFSEFKSYLKYVQPYYKLRIGDFKTKLEARNYLERVIKVFPSAFIVFDDIKVR